MDAVVSLLNLDQSRVVNRFQLERGRVFNLRDAANEQFVERTRKLTLWCQARENLVMHELLHAHLHLLVAIFPQLEGARLGDTVDSPHAAKQRTLEVPEIPQGCCMNIHPLVGRCKGRRLLFSGEEVEMLAPCGQPRYRAKVGRKRKGKNKSNSPNRA